MTNRLTHLISQMRCWFDINFPLAFPEMYLFKQIIPFTQMPTNGKRQCFLAGNKYAAILRQQSPSQREAARMSMGGDMRYMLDFVMQTGNTVTALFSEANKFTFKIYS